LGFFIIKPGQSDALEKDRSGWKKQQWEP